MNLSSPPIIDGKVALDDAIRFIAKQVYPNEVTRNGDPRSDALKRVRERVRYAYNKKVFGRASYHPTNKVDAQNFFNWACGQKNWQALQAVDLGLYQKHSSASVVAKGGGSTSASSFRFTRDEALHRLAECEKELAARDKYIQELESEVTPYRDGKTHRRAVNTENAKKPRKGV